MSITIPTIPCEQCHRLWPCVSEQGIHTTIYGHCYHCMLVSISIDLAELKEKANYTIETCNICAGVEEKRLECRHCEKNGYIVEMK